MFNDKVHPLWIQWCGKGNFIEHPTKSNHWNIWFLVMEQISLVLKFLAIWQRLSCDTECDIILQIFLHGFCLWSDGLGKDTHHHRPPRFGELLATDYCLMAPTWKASLFLLWEPWVCRNNSTVFVGVHMVYKSYMAENYNLHHALGKISVFSYCCQVYSLCNCRNWSWCTS